MMRSTNTWGWQVFAIIVITLIVSGCPKKPPQSLQPGESELGGSQGVGPDGLRDRDLAPRDAGERTESRILNESSDQDGGGPLRDVYFDYDSFDLSSEARDTLQANAEWLKRNTGIKAEIEGHCDERGTVEYNLALGAKRAKAVRDYLVNIGIAPDQLSTISYGEELPACREASESCWQQNRRSHFLLIGR